MQLDNKNITYGNIYNTFFKLLNNDVSTIKYGINGRSESAVLSGKKPRTKKKPNLLRLSFRRSNMTTLS